MSEENNEEYIEEGIEEVIEYTEEQESTGSFMDKLPPEVQQLFKGKNRFIGLGILALLGLVIAYFAIQALYLKPKAKKGAVEIAALHDFFAKDSFNIAAYGNLQTKGAIALSKKYRFTKPGNLAKYYAGISLLKLEKYEEAIGYLKGFSTNDPILLPISKGALADAYSQIGKVEKAASLYLSAARIAKSEFPAVFLYKKSGLHYENVGDYKDALKVYEEMKDKYPKSQAMNDIEKFIGRAKAHLNK